MLARGAAAGSGSFCSRRLRRSLCLGFRLGLLLCEPRVHLGCLRRMNLVIVLVRFRQLLAIQQQPAKPVVGRQLKFVVHLDRFERTHLNADLAAHAHRNVDIELRRINLQLAHVVRLLVLALLDIDALGRTLFLADLAGHAPQPLLPVRPVIHQERKIPRSLRQRQPLLRILHRRQPFLRDKAPGKILRRLRQSLQNPFTQQFQAP